jgi:hypothetical protein
MYRCTSLLTSRHALLVIEKVSFSQYLLPFPNLKTLFGRHCSILPDVRNHVQGGHASQYQRASTRGGFVVVGVEPDLFTHQCLHFQVVETVSKS